MHENDSMISTGFVVGEPFVSVCFSQQIRNLVNKCTEFGFVPELFKTISTHSRFKFQFIEASEYGYGLPSENSSIFSQFRDGLSDFVGPDYYLTSLRNNSNWQVQFIGETSLVMYSKKQFAVPDLNYLDFAGSLLFSLLVVTMLLYLLTSVLSEIISNFPISKLCFNANRLFFMLGVIVLLQLYSNKLAIHIYNTEYKLPNYGSISSLRRAVLSRKVQIAVSPEHDASSGIVVDAIVGDSDQEQRSRILSQIKCMSEGSALRLGSARTDVLAILAGFYVEQTEAWTETCANLVRQDVSRLFQGIPYGFYFNRSNNGAKTMSRKFQQFVVNFSPAVSKLYSTAVTALYHEIAYLSQMYRRKQHQIISATCKHSTILEYNYKTNVGLGIRDGDNYFCAGTDDILYCQELCEKKIDSELDIKFLTKSSPDVFIGFLGPGSHTMITVLSLQVICGPGTIY